MTRTAATIAAHTPLRVCLAGWQGLGALAVEVSRHGGPEELVLVERPDPVDAAGQVVVRNTWIGVNYVDLQHRAGQPCPVRLPLIPGTPPGLARPIGRERGARPTP